LSIIFGPINSRRFGKSLGVDLSPNIKQCNFDCLYCELKHKQKVNEYSDIIDVKTVINDIKNALKTYSDIDVLTITANGEPTLYPHLDNLIEQINDFKKDFKTLILTNSSTINKPKIQEALKKFDIVKLSLDCATKKCFSKLDRPVDNLNIKDIKKGIESFSKIYKGELIIEILIVKGVNDKESEIKELNNFLNKINVKRVDLNTIDRPPAFDVKPLTYKELYNLSKLFSKNLKISIAAKKTKDIKKEYYSKEDILNTLQKRPLTKEDIEILFNNEAKNNLFELLNNNKIGIISVSGVDFFVIRG
jgi:wyosine [tRNA(Phe)-imidazoG37] synthetase (radical SAM superfamily)